jgi:hypothetical protein
MPPGGGVHEGPGTSMIGNRPLLSIMVDGSMPALCARPVRLTASQRHRLKKTARSHSSPHRARLRTQIVLDSAGD